MLQQYQTLDSFLSQTGQLLMFWFFQTRSAFMSQTHMTQWSRNNLDDYILLPASPGFVWRLDCFFVSHFWHSPTHPDPQGEYLRKHQEELAPQQWSYIWLDWSCMPQSPRSAAEQCYFDHCLRTMSGIIRNCGFMWFYPPFKPRLWILYEVAEYVLTCAGSLACTSDIAPFLQHVEDMSREGVQQTLTKHGYTCSDDRDMSFLVPWLELLVLLRRYVGVDWTRKIMDHVTWMDVSCSQSYPDVGLMLNRYEGTLVIGERTLRFEPFPRRGSG